MSCHNPAHVCVGHATWQVQGLIRPSETTTKARARVDFLHPLPAEKHGGPEPSGARATAGSGGPNHSFQCHTNLVATKLLHMLPA